MLTALDADTAGFDESDKKFIGDIRTHGWHGTYVFADEEGPGFGFTTGFWLKAKFPEIIVFSLDRDDAHDIFWHIFKEREAGKDFPVGEPLEDIFENVPAVLLPVAQQQYAAHLGCSRWFYRGNEFPCLQLVFPDGRGHFPWSEKASNAFRKLQPDLTKGDWAGLRFR
jgi:hypothetical protein